MTETLHWYAETSGGTRKGSCAVTENGGVLHLSADLPAGTLKTVRAELPWTTECIFLRKNSGFGKNMTCRCLKMS